MVTNIEETEPAQATATAEPKKAHVAKRARNVAPAKAKSGKKASPAKKARKGAKRAGGARDRSEAAKVKGVRAGSKAEMILELLKRPGGATAKDLLKATSWQPHSLRGFISGTVTKKLGLKVESFRIDDKKRTYRIKA